MTNISTIMGEIGSAGASLNEFISDNKTAVTSAVAGLGGVALGAGAVSIVNKVRSTKSKTKRKSSRKRTVKRRKSRTTKTKKYKYARTAGKRKDRSTKRIRMTKNGQPYVILKSGKARFIKKSSARNSRKRKGGRY